MKIRLDFLQQRQRFANPLQRFHFGKQQGIKADCSAVKIEFLALTNRLFRIQSGCLSRLRSLLIRKD